MSPLLGLHCKWDQFPDWYPRYDFVMKSSPNSTPSKLHAFRDRSNADRLCGVVRYQDTLSCGGAPFKKWWRKYQPKSRAPVHFTSFLYQENGHGHECTRQELCEAFETLVSNWQELLSLARAVYTVWDVFPFCDEGGQARPTTLEEQLAFEDQFFAQVHSTASAWEPIRWRLFWEAEYMGQYLAFLSDMEDAGKLPELFERFPRNVVDIGRDTKPSESKFNHRLRMKLRYGRVDDYAFRAAKKINQSQESEEMTAIRGRLMKLLYSLLEAKGYDAADRISNGCHRSKGWRYQPPSKRQVTSLKIYQDLATNSFPSEYEGRFKRNKYWDYDPAYLSSPHRPTCSDYEPQSPITQPEAGTKSTSPPSPPPPYEPVAPAKCTNASE